MSTIDFSHLKGLAVFASVVESGSFAEAARRLQSSRSRVSEQVAALEASLQVRLLQRTTRQLMLTDEGKRVFEHAKKCHYILDDIDESLSETIPQGRVSITVTNDIAHKFLLPLLPAFKKRYPKIDLNIVSSDDKLDLIANNIDMGLRIGLPRDDSLVGRVLYQERFAIYASPSYIEQNGLPESIDALNKHRWILLSQLNMHTMQYLMLDNKPVEITPKYFELCNSPHLVQEMVKTGLGVSTLLPSTVKSEVENGELVRIFPRLSSEVLLFTLVYPSRKHVPSRTRALIDYLIETCRFGDAPD
ncbi:LysR family transcriptional regulator [Aliiglaciecola aliphaticivorans]